MVFPLPPGRSDTTRHSAFCLLVLLTRITDCPSDPGMSRTVSPPCSLTERERVRTLNLSFCLLISCTVKSAKTDIRAVPRRSPCRQRRVGMIDQVLFFPAISRFLSACPVTGREPGSNPTFGCQHQVPVQMRVVLAVSRWNSLSVPTSRLFGQY